MNKENNMEFYEHEGIKYRKITGHCWTELAELENVYKRRGHRTFLNFGDICSDTFQLTIEMGENDATI